MSYQVDQLEPADAKTTEIALPTTVSEDRTAQDFTRRDHHVHGNDLHHTSMYDRTRKRLAVLGRVWPLSGRDDPSRHDIIASASA